MKFIEKLKNFLNPKQGWLIDKIPDHKLDNSELIRILLFETLVNWVETVDGLYVPILAEGWVYHPENPIHEELKYCYDYIIRGREELLKLEDGSDRLNNEDLLVMNTIIRHRFYFNKTQV